MSNRRFTLQYDIYTKTNYCFMRNHFNTGKATSSHERCRACSVLRLSPKELVETLKSMGNTHAVEYKNIRVREVH